MQVQPSPLLNKRAGAFGFNKNDILAIGVFFTGTSAILSFTPVMVLSFPLTYLVIRYLRPIRLKYRRKIIRDYLGSAVAKKIKFLRRLYVPQVSTGVKPHYRFTR